MPHDKNGLSVVAGDIVLVRCRVVNITPAEDYYNAELQPVIGLPPIGNMISIGAINTKQTQRLTQYAERRYGY